MQIIDIITLFILVFAIGLGIWAGLYSLKLEKFQEFLYTQYKDAEDLICEIARDIPELSEDKIRVQRNLWQIDCKKWVEKYMKEEG